MTATPRSRSRELDPQADAYVRMGWWPDTTVNYLYPKKESMEDFVVDGYASRIKRGEIINNPCNYRSESEVLLGPETHVYEYWLTTDPSTRTYRTEGNTTLFFLSKQAPNLWRSNAAPDITWDITASAKQYALANVDSTPYEFFEDLMEIRETVQFLRAPLAAVKEVCRAYKKRKVQIDRIKDAKRKAKALASLWNQYRFALSPLIRSIMSASEAFLKWEDIKRPKRRSAHGYSDDKSEFTDQKQTQTAGRFFCNFTRTCTKEEVAHAAIHYEVSNPLVDWKFALGLRLKDVPVVLWEIVPLSFMVDRLLDIKSMIGGLVNLADPTVTLLAASNTIRKTHITEISCNARWDSYGAYSFKLEDPDGVRYTDYHLDRETWSPSIGDTVPVLKAKGLVDDVTKVLDLIAISISMLR